MLLLIKSGSLRHVIVQNVDVYDFCWTYFLIVNKIVRLLFCRFVLQRQVANTYTEQVCEGILYV